MSEFVEVKTAELNGAALNWAVAKATGAAELKITEAGSVCCIYEMPCGAGCWTAYYEPSADWSHGGPLIAKNLIEFTTEHRHQIFAVVTDENGMPVIQTEVYGSFGPTHLIAACRALVLTNVGESVSVPKELLS